MTDHELLEDTKFEQALRYDSDVWKEKVEEFVTDKESVSVFEVMKQALNIDEPKMDRTAQNRVTKTLAHLGWQRDGRLSKGRMTGAFQRGE